MSERSWQKWYLVMEGCPCFALKESQLTPDLLSFSPWTSCCQGIVSMEVCYCRVRVSSTGFRQFHYVLWKPDFPKVIIS